MPAAVTMDSNIPDDLKAHGYTGKYQLVTEDKELGKQILHMVVWHEKLRIYLCNFVEQECHCMTKDEGLLWTPLGIHS